MPVTQHEVFIGKNRRATLPESLFKEGEKIIIEKNPVTGLITVERPVVPTVPLIRRKIYAVPIGEPMWSNRFFGILVDENGILVERRSSSTRDFLKIDLCHVNANSRQKLNFHVGPNCWELPKWESNPNNLPDAVKETVLGIIEKFDNGIWPPQ